MRTVTIEREDSVQLSCVTIPIETPAGIVDGFGLCVTINGCRYHIMERESNDAKWKWLDCFDLENGEHVRIFQNGAML